MPNINAPRGFKPIRYVDGRPYNGALNPYRLNSGYATNLFVGDAVKLLTTGYLAKALPGDTIRGVIAGFNWVQLGGIPAPFKYWPAGTTTVANQDAEVLVVDDPGVVFEAVFTNSTAVPVVADIGASFNLFDAGGVAAPGLSGQGIDYTTNGTGAQQFRFLRFVDRQDNDITSAYSRGNFVPLMHDFRVNVGV